MRNTIPHIAFDSYVHADWEWRVNGKSVQERKARVLTDMLQSQDGMSLFSSPWEKNAPCWFCNTPMQTPSFHQEDTTTEEWHVNRCYRLAHCPHCCFWKFRASEGTNKCMDAPTHVVAESVAKKFDTALPEEFTSELAVQLRRDSLLWHTVEPRRMERLVADIFRANYGNVEVIHVGKPGDLGVDVLFVDAGKAEWLIQVKRRESPEAVEGFETLQRLLGTLVLEGKLRGIIATTAKRFSRQLLKQKQRAESRGFIIELLDRGKLDRMLNPMLPKRPWLELMKADFFWALGAEVREHFINGTTVPGECLF